MRRLSCLVVLGSLPLLGCGATGDQNYRINRDSPAIFEETHPSKRPGSVQAPDSPDDLEPRRPATAEQRARADVRRLAKKGSGNATAAASAADAQAAGGGREDVGKKAGEPSSDTQASGKGSEGGDEKGGGSQPEGEQDARGETPQASQSGETEQSGNTENGEPAAGGESGENAKETKKKTKGENTKKSGTSGAAASLRGMDRGHWKSTAVGPARGRVPHAPLYFGYESPLTSERKSPLVPPRAEAKTTGQSGEKKSSPLVSSTPDDGTERVQSKRALSDGGGSLGAHAGDLVLAPVKAMFDLAMLPVSAIVTPPWERQTTPPKDEG